MAWEDQIVKELATKYNLSGIVTRNIIRSPFQFMRDKMSSLEDTRSIRLPYFGVFIYRDYRYPGVNKQVMLLKKAVSIIKEEIRRVEREGDFNGRSIKEDDYVRGLMFARRAIRQLIAERRGKPAEYGLEDEINEDK